MSGRGDRPPGGTLVHLVASDELDRGATHLRPASLSEQGFVHLSRPDQIAWVAGQRFAGRTDLVLLVIDADALDAPLLWEDTEGAGQDFPHLYGPLPMAAVRDVRPYRPGPDGTFPDPAV